MIMKSKPIQLPLPGLEAKTPSKTPEGFKTRVKLLEDGHTQYITAKQP